MKRRNRLRNLHRVAAVALVLTGLWMGACGGDDNAAVKSDVEEPLRFDGGIVVTDAWAGQWHVVTTFRDCEGDAILVVEDVVDWICPGDTIRLNMAHITTQCAGSATDDAIDAGCEYIFRDDPCRVRVALSLDIQRNGDSFEGTGAWTTAVSAGCDDRYPVGCETLTIVGTRLAAGASDCDSLHTSTAAPEVLGRFGWRPRAR